ncbi:uncharacterized protein LOC130758415 [Actinidia eriantha]|uniref:uncharacterized protein LOC130758415 n=1 Tax=Actinidia eriantha TaxID=165200 RepID=UPI00258BB7A4|nr:uncharacterized protein LOC130758415 [Actinidia eriantha]
MDLQKKRVQLVLSVVGIIALSITADKCRQLVGKEASSKSGQFTFLNCFDGSSGTVACVVKEGVKLYFYNIRAAHVEGARYKAIEKALLDALSQGMTAQDAAKQAQQEGVKAAKLATRKAKRIIGPIISSGWDFFEAIYYGGTMTEGFLRGTGTLFGTYAIGFLGEQRFGRFGYLVGSELGSWVGGRIGLMVYDVVNGVHYLLQFVQPEETKVFETPAFGSSEAEETKVHETLFESSESEEPNVFEAPAFGSAEALDNSYVHETPTYMSSEDSNIDESSYESSEGHDEF